MKFIAMTVAAVAFPASYAMDIPNPPKCVTDCIGFELITSGEVDDCAVTSQWADSECMSDCDHSDHTILAHINSLLCRRLSSNDGGSYGSSDGGSYGSSDGGSYGSSDGGSYGSSDGTTSYGSSGGFSSYGSYGSSYGGSYGSSDGGSYGSSDGMISQEAMFAACEAKEAGDCFTNGAFVSMLEDGSTNEACVGSEECAPFYQPLTEEQIAQLRAHCEANNASTCFNPDGSFIEDPMRAMICEPVRGCQPFYQPPPTAEEALAMCEANNASICFNADGSFNEALAAPCEPARDLCAPAYQPEAIAARAYAACAANWASASACFSPLDGSFIESLAEMGCEDARPCAPFVNQLLAEAEAAAGAAVVEIAFVLSFEEELSDEEETGACTTLATDIAVLADIDVDYVECDMTLSDGSRRHLLSFVYNTDIVITVPASVLATSGAATMVEDLQATVADTTALADVVSTSLNKALPNNVVTVTSMAVEVELPEPTDTDAPTPPPTKDATTTDAPTPPPTGAPTDAPDDSSATATSPAFGLLVSIACVALMR